MPDLSSANTQLAAGQTWRHKREQHRLVTITALHNVIRWSPSLRCYETFPAATVKRNTSNRMQAIREETLRRNYKLVTP